MSDTEEKLVMIEHVLDLGDGAHVLFCIPDGATFSLAEDPTLDGRPIRKWLSQPRALDENGNPRLDVFNVTLKSKSDISYFKVERTF